MLSKVAERVYWTGRYLERIESTARLITIYDTLLFDLPRSVEISWYNLILINGIEDSFLERYSVKDEKNVVKFLIADTTNSSSIVSSLNAVRENVRTTRDVVLQDTWELVNELNLFVKENVQQGVGRKQRHEFLEEIIKGCQQILGLLFGNMTQDAPWRFLSLGRNLERADMTTRILEAGVKAYSDLADEDAAVNTRQIILGQVLRSLNADQSYRRIVRSKVNATEVVEFLLENPQFPRSILYCHKALVEHAKPLPSATRLLDEMAMLENKIGKIKAAKLNEKLPDHLNWLQLCHINIHTIICETWFPAWE
ncbi:hypothetical protein NBRC116494_21870 [Aurantivibrio plasticivorans]